MVASSLPLVSRQIRLSRVKKLLKSLSFASTTAMCLSVTGNMVGTYTQFLNKKVCSVVGTHVTGNRSVHTRLGQVRCDCVFQHFPTIRLVVSIPHRPTPRHWNRSFMVGWKSAILSVFQYFHVYLTFLEATFNASYQKNNRIRKYHKCG